MDRLLRAEIVATVRQTMTEVLEGADEVWLSPNEFTEQFQMFSKDWLYRHGELLPRERASHIDEHGDEKFTGWAYPKHKIQRMLREGRLKAMIN